MDTNKRIVPVMASETSPEFNLENKEQFRPIRPKLLKLNDVPMQTNNRNRKKNKFKVCDKYGKVYV